MEELIRDSQNKLDLYKVPFRYLSERAVTLTERAVNVALLCIPCYGFGDVIACVKFSKYITKYFPFSKTTILTTVPEKFSIVSEKNVRVVSIECEKSCQCRRFGRFRKPKHLPKFDVIFIVPLSTDMAPDYEDVKRFIDYSSPSNTYFVSEYNHWQYTDINLGIGEDRDGIFLTQFGRVGKSLLNTPYIYIYIADKFGWERCVNAFIKRCMEEYGGKYRELTIVCPKFIEEYLKRKNKACEAIMNAYPNGGITIRSDLFPAKYSVNMNLMYNSLPNILVTGDQSLSDILSVKGNKRHIIWYQTMDWKMNLAKNLAKALNNPNLKRKSTSCGVSLSTVSQTRLYTLRKRESFIHKAMPKLRAIFYLAQNNRDWRSYYSTIRKNYTSTAKKSLIRPVSGMT